MKTLLTIILILFSTNFYGQVSVSKKDLHGERFANNKDTCVFTSDTTNLFGQISVTKKDLLGEWFANNKDTCFFTSDRVKLYKYIDRKEKQTSLAADPRDFFNDSDVFIYITLKKRHEIFVREYYKGAMDVDAKKEIARWTVKNDTLTFDFDKRKQKFIIDKMTVETYLREVDMDTKDGKIVTCSTFMLTLIRLK